MKSEIEDIKEQIRNIIKESNKRMNYVPDIESCTSVFYSLITDLEKIIGDW